MHLIELYNNFIKQRPLSSVNLFRKISFLFSFYLLSFMLYYTEVTKKEVIL